MIVIAGHAPDHGQGRLPAPSYGLEGSEVRREEVPECRSQFGQQRRVLRQRREDGRHSQSWQAQSQGWPEDKRARPGHAATGTLKIRILGPGFGSTGTGSTAGGPSEA